MDDDEGYNYCLGFGSVNYINSVPGKSTTRQIGFLNFEAKKDGKTRGRILSRRAKGRGKVYTGVQRKGRPKA